MDNWKEYGSSYRREIVNKMYVKKCFLRYLILEYIIEFIYGRNIINVMNVGRFFLRIYM